MDRVGIINNIKEGKTISGSDWELLLEQSTLGQDCIILSAEASRVQATLVMHLKRSFLFRHLSIGCR